MPHSKYKLTDRLVWNKTSLSFELKSKVFYKKGKNKSQIDVIKRTIDKVFLRNMCKYSLSPWLFIHPSETYIEWIYYKDNKPYGVDKWWTPKGTTAPYLYGETRQSLDKIRQLILKYEPQFIYTFNAYIKNATTKWWSMPYIKNLYDIYAMWKKHSYETEMLVKMGYLYLATQKSVYRLSKPKKQELYRWLMKNQSPKYDMHSLCDIQEIVLDIKDTRLFRECHRSIKLYNYLIKQQQDYSYYKDYRDMCKELEKDLKDTYWLYPSDLRERHNKVMEQVNAKREAERIARQIEWERQRKLEKEKEKQHKIEVQEKLQLIPQCKATISGFSLYLANDMQDITEQATALKQCLISCKYYEKVADKTSLLIFIIKDNERIGTCEIGYQKQIKQFYLDEHDRNAEKYTPKQEHYDLVNSYLANLQINQKTKQIKYAY